MEAPDLKIRQQTQFSVRAHRSADEGVSFATYNSAHPVPRHKVGQLSRSQLDYSASGKLGKI